MTSVARSDTPITHVISGIIVRDNHILLTQRRLDKDFPLTWESPGGKVESGESAAETLQRELEEEIGVVDVRIGLPLWVGIFPVMRPDRTRISLMFYEVVHFVGVPRPMEGQGIGWFRARDVARLRLAPGNARALDDILRFMLR